MLHTIQDAEDLIYQSYLRAISHIKEKADAKVKRPELTRKLFGMSGSPDKGQKFILVTGSKGKGSTARFISSLLGHHGLKVGLFTSPHLVHFNERIRINGKAISDEDFVKFTNQIEGSFLEIEAQLRDDEYQGPIGLALAIACLYFKENDTDINVIECGRGGMFDDTNILDNEWAVITPILEEHLAYLGPTIHEVIDHKLGIIKPSTKGIYLSEQKYLGEILDKIGEVPHYGEEFYAENIMINSDGTTFDIKTKAKSYENLTLPILGHFQAINAATALKVCEDVMGGELKLEKVKKCFSGLQWPGRCEIIDREPTVILDGAIHEASARQVQQVIEKLNGKKVVSIVGVPADKDYKGVIRVVSEFSNRIIVTRPDISHLVFPEDALQVAQERLANAVEAPLLADALDIAMNEPDVDIILIIGTQTLLANAKRLWNQSLLDIGI